MAKLPDTGQTVNIGLYWLINLNMSEDIDFSNPQHCKIALQFQLKMLQLYGPTLGIYALPSLDQPNIWNGIIFVRTGYYRDGKFKFNINMDGFPLRRPTLFFLSKVHHPMVNPETGEVDVGSLLAEPWSYYSHNMLYGMMKDLRRMFTDRRCTACKTSFHPQVAGLLESNLHEFIVRAMQSVSDSKEQLYVNGQGWSLKASEGNEESEGIKKTLDDVVGIKDLKTEDKVQMFLSMIMQ